MKITLDIPDNQLTFFMELMRKLGFAKIHETEELPETHRAILEQRMKRLSSGEGTLKPWTEFQKELDEIV